MSLNQFNWSSEDYDGLFEKEVPSQLLNNPLLQKDVWRTIEDLGLETHEHQKRLTLNFSKIQPNWFNLLAKLYVLTRANLKLSISYIGDDVSRLRNFAKFLQEKRIDDVKYINNDLFEQFDYWIHSTGVKERTISSHYITLRNFFDTCRREGWLDVKTYWFCERTPRIRPNNDDINYLCTGQKIDSELAKQYRKRVS